MILHGNIPGEEGTFDSQILPDGQDGRQFHDKESTGNEILEFLRYNYRTKIGLERNLVRFMKVIVCLNKSSEKKE